MYDRNGLELSPVAETFNSYRLTAINMSKRKYTAYAQASRDRGEKQWSMFNIADFDDPRDAAFVAQEFAKLYDRYQIRQMVTDGSFREVCKEFLSNLEIPEWQFPAEGLSFEDITGDYGYRQNYVSDARQAVLEVIRMYQMPTLDLAAAKQKIAEVEKFYARGLTLREAAKFVMGV
jgi:hypothetical protein